MPFKYVQGDDGKPIMPNVRVAVPESQHAIVLISRQGMLRLLVDDMDKGIGDLL